MKLIYCINCDSIIRLIPKHRECECKKCGGMYIDELNAIYYGKPATTLGIDNNSLAVRLRGDVHENIMYNLSNKLEMDSGTFKAFLIGGIGGCAKTFTKLTKKEYERQLQLPRG